MEATTANSMNLLALKDDERMGLRLPAALKDRIETVAGKVGVKPAKFVKMAIIEKIDKENL